MGKLVRVLAVLLLTGSIAALTLSNMLFRQRELLKGRAGLLEEKLVEIADTFEAERASVDSKPQYPARDIDDCTADLIDSPERSDFWDSYTHELEIADVPTLQLNKRREDLKSYYQRDEITGKVIKDQFTGRKITTGERTMESALKDVIARAEDQLILLNETRQQLLRIRRELVDAITELNRRKGKLRESKNTIVQKDEEIARMEGVIRDLESQIEGLEGDIRGLNDTIAQQKSQLEVKIEKIQGNRDEIARLEEELEKITPSDLMVEGGTTSLARGSKGVVQRANENWNFIVIKLSPAFLSELMSDPMQRTPTPTLIIKRKKAGKQQFIAKAKLMNIRPEERIGVAEVLKDWQQQPIREGDEVFF